MSIQKSAVHVLACAALVALSSGMRVGDARAQHDNSGRTALTPAEVDALVTKIERQIEGKEGLPSEQVFQNIKTLEGIPAGRLLRIMKFGFSRSLGVDCTYCHDTDKWESDEKPTKQVTRDMWAFAGRVNDLLAKIPNLESENPMVNCTTCHRGQKKPALNLD